MTRGDLQNRIQLILDAVYRANIAAAQSLDPGLNAVTELIDAEEIIRDVIHDFESEGVTIA